MTSFLAPGFFPSPFGGAGTTLTTDPGTPDPQTNPLWAGFAIAVPTSLPVGSLFAAGAAASPPGGVLNTTTAAAASTTYFFPPIPKTGWAKVAVTSKAKTDTQKTAGKSKAKTKKTGIEPLEVTIDMTWTLDAWGGDLGVDAMLTAIDPDGPGGGGPFGFFHPDFSRRGGAALQVTEVGPIVWTNGGYKGACKITGKEWTDPTAASAGVGTQTPTTAPDPNVGPPPPGADFSPGPAGPPQADGTPPGSATDNGGSFPATPPPAMSAAQQT